MMMYSEGISFSKKSVVIFNGPPGSGKDECARYFSSRYNSKHMEQKKQLLDIAILVSGVSEEEWFERYENRDLKEIPWRKLGDISQRQFLIRISEEWVKPLFGKDYFGNISADKIYKANANNFFFSDGGFVEETIPIKNVCDNLIIIRLHRENCNFNNDSRNYLYMKDNEIVEFDIENNETLIDMYIKINDNINKYIIG